MVDEEEQEIAQRCINKIAERDGSSLAGYCAVLFIVLYPEIDAVVCGMNVYNTLMHMFKTAPFDAHVETIYRIAFDWKHDWKRKINP